MLKGLNVMTFIAIMYVWYKMATIAVEEKLLKWFDGLEWIGSIVLNGSIAGNP